MSKESPPVQDTSAVLSWLPSLLGAARLSGDEPLKEIGEKMDALANQNAPLARGWWKGMVTLQGLSVVVPLLWLLRRNLGLPPGFVALGTAASVALLVTALWWMRWRGTQRTWTRARLVAEVARGRMAADLCPGEFPLPLLANIPALKPLLERSSHAEPVAPWPQWRDRWIAARLDHQLDYYRSAKAKAEAQRLAFTQGSTRLMDVMLSLAAAALLISLDKRSSQWLRVFGDQWLEWCLGFMGTLLPLGLILLQTLRSRQGVDHRVARFARQIGMLERAREELQSSKQEADALVIVGQTEAQLLGEVVDWYFEAETAERFFQVRGGKEPTIGLHVGTSSRFRWLKPTFWAVALGGMGLQFLGQALLGRVPWVACSSALTLCWLSYASPDDPEGRKTLEAVGHIREVTGEAWNPDSARAEHGCIIIAHGLHDGAFANLMGKESKWMREMSHAIQARLKDRCPNIGLVDWPSGAFPAELHGIHIPNDRVAQVLDVAGIRAQARNMGDYLAFRLAQWTREGRIRKDRPLHFIGHSAGGFVISRAARILRELNFAPSMMQVTILDTPGADAELLVETPRSCAMDLYITSNFVLGLSEEAPPTGVFIKRIWPEEELSLVKAHAFAHKWYTQSITSAAINEHGFGRSPILKLAFAEP